MVDPRMYDRISVLCTQHNTTPGKLCSELGMSRSVLSDLKSGRKKSLNAETAYGIAAHFGVSVGYLLGKEPAHTVTKDDIKEALFGSSDVPEETYQEVLHYARYLMTK